MVSGGIGLYVHVPYCLKKCSYCAFASERKPEDVSGMCTAIRAEFMQRTRNMNHDFRTLYAGGGTPSLLPPEFWAGLIGRAKSSRLEEITIETNPAILDRQGYSTLLLAGFNRISLGVQSFSNRFLGELGRIHDAEAAEEALKAIRQTGFRNVSADLMYGLPGQTPEDQKRDIEKLLEHDPEHISLYELTLEKGTPMGEAGRKAPEEVCAHMYHQAHEILTGSGYIHYEVSSYARGKEYISRHNSAYWNRVPYLGIGPSAHSFDGAVRSWNHSDAGAYESAVIRGEEPTEAREELTGENAAHELLALGFRHSGGVSLGELGRLGYRLDPGQITSTGMVTLINDTLVPDEKGMLFADSLALKAASHLEELTGV